MPSDEKTVPSINKYAYDRLMKVLFLLGWGFLIIAFGASAAEMAAHGVGGARGMFISLSAVISAMWPNTWSALQNTLGFGLSKALFALPGWLTFGLPGGLLVWFCRPNKEGFGDEDSDSMDLFDELSKQAKRDGYGDDSREDYFDEHKDIEGLDGQGATASLSDKDYTVDLEQAAKRDPGPGQRRR